MRMDENDGGRKDLHEKYIEIILCFFLFFFIFDVGKMHKMQDSTCSGVAPCYAVTFL